ncbi:MAG: hypothetical protein CL779_03460 [Chloroflexi bacterium]|nr:hypothetical protein [Chloroflexota bacterium]
MGIYPNKAIKNTENRKRNMSTQFNANVYHFTNELVSLLLNQFEGKVVGSDEMNLDVVMTSFFGDYSPGDKVLLDEEEGGGENPPPKKKKKKDPSAPKRPTTAFFYYTSSIRSQVTKENPGKSVADLSKVYSEMWKNLSEGEKEVFHEMNKKDKERYAAEKKAFEEKQGGVDNVKGDNKE